MFALCVTACADIEVLTPGACGNGVVDSAAEDCDSTVPPTLGQELRCGPPHDPTRACRLLCENDQCPAGWACGPDRTCVHGSGRWTEAQPVALTFDDWSLGHVDGDGLIDIIGVRGGELEARFGDGSARFEDGSTRYFERSGDVAFRDANGDGLLEVAVPTPAGVVVFAGDTAREVAPRPLAFAPEVLKLGTGPRLVWGVPVELGADGCRAVASFNTNDDITGVRGVVFQIPNPNSAAVWQFMVSDDACPDASDPNCFGGAAVVFPKSAGAPIDDGGTVLLAFPGLGHARLITPVVGGPGQLKQWPLGPQHTVAPRGAPLVFTAAAGDSEVFVPGCGDGVPQLLHATRTSDGSLSPFAPDPRFDLGTSCDSPTLAVLAATDFDADGLADFVLSTGVRLGAPSGLSTVNLPIAAKWREAVTADFDGNGHLDIAAARADSARIDVMYSDSCNPNCAWTDGHIDLPSTPEQLRAANFDGVGATDLAFLTRTGEKTRVQVAFSTGEALASLDTVAVLPGAQRMEASRFQGPDGFCDAAADLLISRVIDGDGGYSVLFGSAHRAMYAPVSLGAEAKFHQPVSVVLARTESADDPLLFAQTSANDGKSVYTAHHVLAEGLIAPIVRELESAALCQEDGSLSKSAFLWTAADLDHDGVEEVIGVEGRCPNASAASTRVMILLPETPPQQRELSVAPDVLRELLIYDLDADGELDLALAKGEALAIHWGAHGGWSSDVLDLPMNDARSLALLDADGAAGTDLAVLSADGFVVLSFSGRTPTELWRGPPGEKVRAADVNGDSVDDLLLSESDRIRVLLGVPHTEVPH
ncbi:MAG: hypothetical protein AMXMBFR56_80070 [Polyangiaceae bacterium]